MPSAASHGRMNGESSMNENNICRDFLRNVCNRGGACKFRHPEGDEAKALGKKDLIFCHDFQNKECRRLNCRFIHCTKQEEEVYRSSGYIAEHILESVSQKAGMNPQLAPNVPICKDFLKGDCKRSGRCKFRHVVPGQYHSENPNPPVRRPPFEANFEAPHTFSICQEQPKRYEENNFSPFSTGNPLQEQQHFQHIRMLQEENARLLHKIEELKKQVVDLTATNQFLREQNEHMRSIAAKDWYMSTYQNSYLQ